MTATRCFMMFHVSPRGRHGVASFASSPTRLGWRAPLLAVLNIVDTHGEQMALEIERPAELVTYVNPRVSTS